MSSCRMVQCDMLVAIFWIGLAIGRQVRAGRLISSKISANPFASSTKPNVNRVRG